MYLDEVRPLSKLLIWPRLVRLHLDPTRRSALRCFGHEFLIFDRLGSKGGPRADIDVVSGEAPEVDNHYCRPRGPSCLRVTHLVLFTPKLRGGRTRRRGARRRARHMVTAAPRLPASEPECARPPTGIA